MRDFLKYTLASLVGSILFFIFFITLSALGALGLIGVLIASFSDGEETRLVKKDSVLVYDLSTLISDAEYELSPTEALLGGIESQLTLRDAINGIEAAAEDDNIVALYLAGDDLGVGVGAAALKELREAIKQFRAAGKPIIAYDVSWTEAEYYLASVADTIAMNPFGDVEMNGLYSEVRYQAETFNKLGIGIQVTRVGRYKSAVEPLIRNDMSPEEREQTQRLLSDLWGHIIYSAAEFRDIEAPQLQAIANGNGFLFGEDAQTQGLVDKVAYLDEVIQDLRQLTGEAEASQDAEWEDEASFRQINLSEYASGTDDPLEVKRSDNQIALVYAEGPIVDGEGEGLSQVIAGDKLARHLRQLRLDDDVKAVVLRVNSPGGSAIASEVILREVQLCQEAGKPVIVSMGNVAASGGYWIAASADQIFAEPTTITGSIGVFGFFPNLEDLGEKIGVNWEVVKTGDTADIFTITRPKTPKELNILQTSVDSIYDEFLERVAQGRDLPLERVAELAQGRVWSGSSAKDLGLVDELGGLDAAIAAAATAADLGDDWNIRKYPESEGWQRFFEQFFGSDTVDAAARPTDPLTAQLGQFQAEIQMLRTLNDPRHIYARMPIDIDID
ncbi:MAG: signal peptide peptidase SppA [Thainema sp.]